MELADDDLGVAIGSVIADGQYRGDETIGTHAIICSSPGDSAQPSTTGTRNFLFNPLSPFSSKYNQILSCRLCQATTKSVTLLPATRLSAIAYSPVPPRLVKLLCAVPQAILNV